ncbi:MAG: hypothetical protein ACQESR_03595 [Planctomycetota bacterium]
MSTSKRATKLTKAHKVLQKHYEPPPVAERLLLEQLLYACCLEFAPAEAADEAFAKLQQTYYDWNEVRVTTVSELCEVLSRLPKPQVTASHLRRTLQSVFEQYYSFDLEPLKKENIGKAVQQLEKLDGISKFAMAFVIQNGLGGHAIAVSGDARETLRVLGIISDEEAAEKRVPGLERAIPKNKGAEFRALLHQLAVEYGTAPFSPRVRSIMLEIAPDAKQRFPKRSGKKTARNSADKSAGKSEEKKKTVTGKKDTDIKKSDEKKTGSKKGGGKQKKSNIKQLSKRKPR